MIYKLKIINLCLFALLLSSAIVNSQFAIFQVGAIAQSVLSTLIVSGTNPNVLSDHNDLIMMQTRCVFDGDAANNTGFTNDTCIDASQVSTNGQNTYASATHAKRNYTNLKLYSTHYAAGQRLLWSHDQTCYGMGDCFLGSQQLTYASAGNVAGDEGRGYQSVSTLQQQGSLQLTTIASIPAQTTCNTTLTQAITAGGYAPQTVTVASTSNCNVNDWVIIDQSLANAGTLIEAVHITAVGGGTITGVFRNNHASGVTVTPAKVIVVDDSVGIGQQRVIVNLSGTSYATGTVSAINGGGFTGSGTTWATNMVGGNATNIGCIALTADDYSGLPFNGSGANGTLKSWYQISAFTSVTSIGIFSWSTAGDAGYHGMGPGPAGSGGSSAFTVKPCTEVLYTSGTTIVMESTATTWTVGDSIETIISPYPDVSGFQYQLANYTSGGQGMLGFEFITNIGARTIQNGISLRGQLRTGGNADTVAWGNGFTVDSANYGFVAGPNIYSAAISLSSKFGSGTCVNDLCGQILWNGAGAYIRPNSDNLGMDLQLTMSGTGGLLSTKNPSAIGTGSRPVLTFDGMLGTTAVAFSALPTCAAGTVGYMVGITDSNTATFNATVAGSGSNKGIAYCNGTNWTFR